jgi:septal ring factor EnvC (AmiA/AmiB activator)
MRLFNRHRIIITSFLTFILFAPISAQTVKQLELQRKQTLERLQTTSKMLNETKKSQRSSLNKLSIISRNINERKTLIKNINSEIVGLDSSIQQLNQQKTQLENRLTVLKKDYVKLVQEAHINRSIYAKIMFVLSAKSFDQSYRRLRYLQEYTNYRKQQVQEIDRVRTEIIHKNDSLQVHKNTKVEVVKQKVTETQRLATDQKKEKVVLTELHKKERKLRVELQIQQRKAAELNNKIERIIAEEIRKAEAKRAAEAKRRMAEERRAKTTSKTSNKTQSEKISKEQTSSVSALTKEETLLSGDFERNKGRLPWPTSNGFISGHFGIHEHPVLKHVMINNKGIYIQTPAGSNARAVFEGVVTQRFSIPGSNNGVIIQHGNYRTVYANLTQIFVREGEKVSAKQPIGKIYTDDEKDNKTELYFQIWNGKNLQNPELWISR